MFNCDQPKPNQLGQAKTPSSFVVVDSELEELVDLNLTL